MKTNPHLLPNLEQPTPVVGVRMRQTDLKKLRKEAKQEQITLQELIRRKCAQPLT